MADTQPQRRRGLAAIVGAVAAAGLIAFTPSQEGRSLTTYRDMAGVLTYCDGATENAVLGKMYSPAECDAQTDRDLARHADGISKCVDFGRLTDGQKVAFVDLAYNVGVVNFCGSSAARKANAGDVAGSCAALVPWSCIRVEPGRGDTTGLCAPAAGKPPSHKFVRGLYERRLREQKICLGSAA